MLQSRATRNVWLVFAGVGGEVWIAVNQAAAGLVESGFHRRWEVRNPQCAKLRYLTPPRVPRLCLEFWRQQLRRLLRLRLLGFSDF
jgi:hypothetical protein